MLRGAPNKAISETMPVKRGNDFASGFVFQFQIRALPTDAGR
jgi:hypothetical protein